MKQIFLIGLFLAAADFLKAQDIITLKTGEIIRAKVTEVGVNEVKYYKTGNLQGPLYVTSKADVALIVYTNGMKDVFTNADNQPSSSPSSNVIVVPQQAPQTVVVKRSARRGWPYIYPWFVPHIDLGHHIDVGHHDGGHGGGYHGGHH